MEQIIIGLLFLNCILLAFTISVLSDAITILKNINNDHHPTN
jgi:hypothetical protein